MFNKPMVFNLLQTRQHGGQHGGLVCVRETNIRVISNKATTTAELAKIL